MGPGDSNYWECLVMKCTKIMTTLSVIFPCGGYNLLPSYSFLNGDGGQHVMKVCLCR